MAQQRLPMRKIRDVLPAIVEAIDHLSGERLQLRG